jgi:hypothetical protein
VFANATVNFEPTTASFDSFIAAQDDSSPDHITRFQNVYDCPNYAGAGLRFRMTTLCGLFVDVSTFNNQCNTGTPQQVCPSTAQSYLASHRELFADATICNAAPDAAAAAKRRELLDTAEKFITRLPPQARTPPSCVDFLPNSPEASNCGFHSAETALGWCTKNSPRADPCCSAVANFVGQVAATTVAGSAPTSTANSTTQPTQTVADTPSGDQQVATEQPKILGLDFPIFLAAVIGGSVLLISIIIGSAMAIRRSSRAKQAQLESSEMPDYKNNDDVDFKPASGNNNMYNSTNGGSQNAYGSSNGMDMYGNQSQNGMGNMGMDMQNNNNNNDFNNGFNNNNNNNGFNNNGFNDMNNGGFNSGNMNNNFDSNMNMNNNMNFNDSNGMNNNMAASGAGLGAAAAAAGMGMGMGGMGAGMNANPEGPVQIADTMEVVFNYVPNLSDEIYLCKYENGSHTFCIIFKAQWSIFSTVKRN